MMKVALNVLKDTFLAEDAVHETFIKIAKNMEKIGEINATAPALDQPIRHFDGLLVHDCLRIIFA